MIAAAKGHMQQQQKNLRITKEKVQVKEKVVLEENKLDKRVKTGDYYFTIIPIVEIGKTFSD